MRRLWAANILMSSVGVPTEVPTETEISWSMAGVSLNMSQQLRCQFCWHWFQSSYNQMLRSSSNSVQYICQRLSCLDVLQFRFRHTVCFRPTFGIIYIGLLLMSGMFPVYGVTWCHHKVSWRHGHTIFVRTPGQQMLICGYLTISGDRCCIVQLLLMTNAN